MKKTYIIPELEVILEETSQQLLAASVPELSGQAYEGEDILAPGMDSEDLLDF
jgi:hypothetical protein